MVVLLMLMTCFTEVHMLIWNFNQLNTDMLYNNSSGASHAQDKVICANQCYLKDCCSMFTFKAEAKVCYTFKILYPNHTFTVSQGLVTFQRKIEMASYVATVTTGSQSGAETNADISLQYFGKDCVSSLQLLDVIDFDDFQKNSTASYELSDVDVGEIQKTRVFVRMYTPEDDWFFVSLKLKKTISSERRYIVGRLYEEYYYNVSVWITSTSGSQVELNIQHNQREYV